MTQVQAVEQAYAGRHRGEARTVVPITEHLAMVEGLYRQVSVSSGAAWWSADGNSWAMVPEATGAHAACPCRDCTAPPVIPLAVPHYDCCGQSRRAPWCQRSAV